MRRLRWLLVPVLVVPLTWLLFQGFGRDPRAVTSPLIGQSAPGWELTTLDGETLGSADLEGRPYVVNFWASWCIPACVDEHPVLVDAYERWGDEVEMVGIVYQDEAADARAFLERYGETGYAHVIDAESRAAVDFGVTGPPETFFVDADGIVRYRQVGPLTDELMAEHVSLILPAAAR